MIKRVDENFPVQEFLQGLIGVLCGVPVFHQRAKSGSGAWERHQGRSTPYFFTVLNKNGYT